jgi:pyridoxal phosphate enzyme (YggS family)
MSANNNLLADGYQRTLADIDKYAGSYQRSPQSVKLVAVSKRHPAESVFQLIKLGHREFGENYVQEGLEKIDAVEEMCTRAGIEANPSWHFIGHIQSRKCRDISEKFQWVHTIESEKVANRLNNYREGREPLNVLIQVNLQDEPGKSGISADFLPHLADTVSTLPNLRLRGLMLIPREESDYHLQRQVFIRCREQLEYLNRSGFALDQLSMGMTGDMEAAISAGATLIRIGTAIFGPRPA